MLGALGTIIDPSTRKIISSKNELVNFLSNLIDKHYTIVPTPGSGRTVSELKTRIIESVVQQIADGWNIGLPQEEADWIIGNPFLQDTVYDIAPFSKPNTSSASFPPITSGTKFNLPSPVSFPTISDTPKPGSTGIDLSSFGPAQINDIIKSVFGGLSSQQQSAAQKKLLEMQAKKQTAYIPTNVAHAMGLSTGEKVAIGIGSVAFLGVIGFLIYKAAKGK